MCSQVYVQDILQRQLEARVLEVLHGQQGHVYVCGDVRMARDVAKVLQELLARALRLSQQEANEYFQQLKVAL